MSENDLSPMVFDSIIPLEVPITLADGHYVLKEASAEAVRQYRNSTTNKARYSEGKLSGVTDIADAEPLLVSLCLFPIDGLGTVSDKHVTKDFILSLPHRIQKSLYERLRNISKMEDDGDEIIKKSLKAVFSQEGSPATFNALQSFVVALPSDPAYRQAKAVFALSEGETAKN